MNLTSRFLRYCAIPTMSDEGSEACPSTEKQFALAHLLVKELKEMGLTDARVDEHCYVYATLPANAPAKAKIGFIAHMDTSPDAPDAPIKAREVKYEGGDLALSAQAVLSPRDFPYLDRCIGHRLIVTDGTTLLGGDDKAGIAIIMTAVKQIIDHQLPHGQIAIGFTPDEEIGRGADLFDVAAFDSDYAYTVDGGEASAIDYENFNAASATVILHGRGIHPGSAKGKMKNACLMANDFLSRLPAKQTPADTEGYEGFYHLTDMEGDVEKAVLRFIIRDHDMTAFLARKETLLRIGREMEEAWGEGACEVLMQDSYFNMKQVIDTHPEVIDRAVSAMKSLGMEPLITPIRGGTDGARLSFMGLPCPNLGTGDQNAHSRFEYVSVEEMEQVTALVVRLCTDLVQPE